jgi:uncharacterized LabA/DUF88 family protein
MKQESNPIIYAFIDSQNLNLAVKDQGWELDFARFHVYLKEKYGVSKAFLFIGYVPGNEDLYTSLQKMGYIIVFKPTLEIRGKTKGNVDAELVLHSMIEFPNYDKALIVSGDGDFHCLIKYLSHKSKLLNLLIPNQYKHSSLLKEFIPFIRFINSLRDKLSKK